MSHIIVLRLVGAIDFNTKQSLKIMHNCQGTGPCHEYIRVATSWQLRIEFSLQHLEFSPECTTELRGDMDFVHDCHAENRFVSI